LSFELGLRDLVLFNIAAVVGIRSLAAAGFFLVPSALAVSRLTAGVPKEGGLHAWTRNSLGDWHGFLCGWCYWLSNLFFFPSRFQVFGCLRISCKQ
jgi:amino acid transporter